MQQGRKCIERQLNVIASLRGRGLPTDEAERVLIWLEEVPRSFEKHFNQGLLDGQERLAKYEALAAMPPPGSPGSLSTSELSSVLPNAPLNGLE